MRHKVAGRKLGRTSNERRALFRSLANQFILHEKIVTTEAKAKAVRPMIEKLITTAKKGDLTARRALLKELVAENTVRKMIELIGPKFKNRPGGYTRLVKTSYRSGDRAPMTTLMFVEAPSQVELPKKNDKEKPIAVEILEEVKTDVEGETKKTSKVLDKKPRQVVSKKGTNDQDK